MLNTIFGRSLWERKISTFAYSLGLFTMALLFTSIFETFASDLAEVVDGFPEAFSAFIGDLGAATTPSGWLNIELYGLFVPLIAALVGVGFGASAIGQEENDGTLELLLASPISRSKIMLQKLLAIGGQLFIVTQSTWLGVATGTILFNFDVSLTNVFWASMSAWLLGMVFATLALAAQSLSGKRRVGLGIGAGALVLTYLADVVSKLVEQLEFLKYASPFYYFDIANVLNGGPTSLMWVLLGVSAVFYAAAHVSFIRRDTGV